MTLSDPDVRQAIEERWVSTWHNQCPGLYCNNTVESRKPIPYPGEQLASVKEGAGGGNIRFYFCDPEGRVLSYLSGFVDAKRILNEEKFARNLLALDEEHRVCAMHLREDGLLELPEDPEARAIVRRRLQNLQSAAVGKPVRDVLRDIEDAIYTKGAIG